MIWVPSENKLTHFCDFVFPTTVSKVCFQLFGKRTLGTVFPTELMLETPFPKCVSQIVGNDFGNGVWEHTLFNPIELELRRSCWVVGGARYKYEAWTS